MKLKIILACLIAIQIASCQTNDETEISNNNDDINSTEIVQLVTVSDNLDLANLPTNSNYIKEQSLKGENASPYGYILRRPKEFGQDGLKYPILIYLHGSGSKGNSAINPEDINKVDRNGPIRSIKQGIWNPFVAMPVFAPQSGVNWNPDHVHSFIEYIINTYPNSINTDRIYISGFSMGAAGAWTFLDAFCYENCLIAAAVTMAGAKEEVEVEFLKLMPFWAFHGKLDGAVPVSKSINLVDSFRSLYPSQEHQRLTIFTQEDFDGQYHRIDDGVYDRTSWDKSQTGDEFNVDVVNWMLQFKRND